MNTKPRHWPGKRRKPRRLRLPPTFEQLESRNLLAADVFEPNDSFNSAFNLGSGNQFHADLTIHQSMNDDWYKWTATSTGQLTVDALFSHQQGDLDLQLYGANQNLLALSDTLSDNERISRNVVAGQMYFIRVYGFNGATQDDYDLRIDAPQFGIAADRFEPNDAFSQASVVGSGDQTHNGLTIHSPFNEDWYQWTASASGTLAVDVLFSQAVGNVDLELHDSGKNVLASSTSTTDNERAAIGVFSGQTYFIRVFGPGGATQTSYDLRIDGPETTLFPDALEPNDSFAQASNVGTGNQTRSGLSVHAPFNDDWYKWTASASATLTVDILFAQASGNLDLEVYNSNQNLLASSNSTTDNERVAVGVVAGQMYSVRVLGAGGATQSNYQLRLTTSDPFEPNNRISDAADLGTGEQTHGGLSIKDSQDEDWYEWTAAQNGSVTVDITFSHAAGDIDLELYNSSANLLDVSDTLTDNEQVSAPVLAGQMYFIRVFGFGGSTNSSYSLTIRTSTGSGPPPPGQTQDVLFFSVASATSINGLSVANEDIVMFDGNNFELFFDGSDVGLSNFALDAIDVIDDSEILLSFNSGVTVPGISGTVDDSDIIKFTATSTGSQTRGNFSLFLDASDVGLSTVDEDVKAVRLLGNGNVLISTSGPADVPGVNAGPEDVLALAPTSLGATTAGSWSLYFDGSDVGLSGENVDGIGLDAAGKIYLSTADNFSVPGVSGTDEDVFVFVPTSLGTNTFGSFNPNLFFDGSNFGLANNDLVGISVSTRTSPVQAGVTVTPSSGLVTTESGGTASFQIVLNTPPTQSVTIPVKSNDPTEGQTSFSNLTFTPANWNVPQTVTVRGIDDSQADGDVPYTVMVGATSSGDPNYNGLNLPDVSLTNLDNETVVLANVLYFSVATADTVGGVSVANEDIVAYDGTGFELFFDGSDVGLGGFALDAIDVISPTEILMSFSGSGTVPGISGAVDDSDIVKFTATSLGSQTQGSFSLFFDGSDVGLNNSNEDVKAVELLTNGNLLISTFGPPSVPGVNGEDEDVLAFTPTSLGSSTAGSWSLYFDGSDVGLAEENVYSVAVDTNGKIYFSTSDKFVAPGIAGENEDVFSFVPASLGANTSGTYDSALFFDGSNFGLSGNALVGVDVARRPGSAPQAGITVSPPTGLVTTEGGGTANLQVVLDAAPTQTVTVPVRSDDTTEGQVSTSLLSFTSTNWNVPQVVTVRGIDDSQADGDVAYTVTLGPASSGDTRYSGLTIPAVGLTNTDNEFVPRVDILYFSVASATTLGGVSVDNEDVVVFDGTDFELFFDGSDVGLAGFALDAIDVISPNEILMSFSGAGSIPGISGGVDDSDVVRFTATSLGSQTQGTFSLYFDGSDVGLDGVNEDVKAVELLTNGSLLISTSGASDVPGVVGQDEDILAFAPTSLGDTTAGTWSLYFDGSDVGLAEENVDALGLDSLGRIYLSTDGDFQVSGVSGADEDVFVFVPFALGANTTGTFNAGLFFDGSLHGLASNDLLGIDIP